MSDYWDELEKMEEERDAQEYAEAMAYSQGYKKGRVDALEEFCSEIDLEEPMHFTKEQVRWIKKYVIVKRQNVIEECLNIIKFHENDWDGISWAIKELEELKE